MSGAARREGRNGGAADMPEVTFVLPHWLYWSGLILFPLVAMLFYRRRKEGKEDKPLSLSLAYFLLIAGGFIGVHRMYLKSAWSLLFILIFSSVLFVNLEVREARNDLSGVHNQIRVGEFKLQRAQRNLQKGRRGAEARVAEAREKLARAKAALNKKEENSERWNTIAMSLGGALLLLLLIDALLLPKLVRQRNDVEKPESETGFHCPVVEKEHDDKREPFAFNRAISRFNGLAGEFVAYWSLIAVFVYYYEVIARYVFNSPTNWAHESMFLMFGMQYLIAGGFVLREGGHVRVDVIYNQLPKRGKAIVDVFTSIFFFIFMVTLLVTGWTFFHDSYEVGEVSFTEWAIHYWPVKLALPIGAVLLLVQGAAQLAKDVAVAINPSLADLETHVRPEG